MGKRGPKRQRHDVACPNEECECYGKVNGENSIGHGAYKGGQRYKCKACGRTFTERTNTPLARLRTPTYIVALVMYLLGLSVASIALVVGKQEKTVERWISRIVPHCEDFVEHMLDKERHNFTPCYLQADELWTYIWSKRGKQRVWIVIDGVTKLFIAFSVGARDRISAEKLFEMTVARIRGIPLLTTTDGNETYPGMVKKFLKGTIYAQVIKTRVGARIVSVTKKVITGESLNKVNNVVKSLKTTSNTVNTAFVERFMLTLRQCLCSLHRKTLAAAKTRAELVAQITLFHVFYNFVRPHMSLTMGKGRGKQKRTPAMTNGLTDHCWSWYEVLTYHVDYQ